MEIVLFFIRTGNMEVRIRKQDGIYQSLFNQGKRIFLTYGIRDLLYKLNMHLPEELEK